MNAAHLHLFITHLPLCGVGLAALLLAWGAKLQSEDLKKASLWLLLLMAVLTAPAYLSGDTAFQLVKSAPGVTRELVEQHEEVAALAAGGMAVLGVVALVGLVLFRGKNIVPGWFATLTLGVAIIAAGLLAWTSNLGGKIHHPEIRDPSATTNLHV